MDEKLAIYYLGDWIRKDGSLKGGVPYVSWDGDIEHFVTMDGTFDLADLKAIVWWMENKAKEVSE